MLNNPSDEIKNREEKENNLNESVWLFTKSRILFLISVFIVVSIPLFYRYLSYYFL